MELSQMLFYCAHFFNMCRSMYIHASLCVLYVLLFIIRGTMYALMFVEH